MGKRHICPTCGGTGKVETPKYFYLAIPKEEGLIALLSKLEAQQSRLKQSRLISVICDDTLWYGVWEYVE
jgi:hypothetical protein